MLAACAAFAPATECLFSYTTGTSMVERRQVSSGQHYWKVVCIRAADDFEVIELPVVGCTETALAAHMKR